MQAGERAERKKVAQAGVVYERAAVDHRLSSSSSSKNARAESARTPSLAALIRNDDRRLQKFRTHTRATRPSSSSSSSSGGARSRRCSRLPFAAAAAVAIVIGNDHDNDGNDDRRWRRRQQRWMASRRASERASKRENGCVVFGGRATCARARAPAPQRRSFERVCVFFSVCARRSRKRERARRLAKTTSAS